MANFKKFIAITLGVATLVACSGNTTSNPINSTTSNNSVSTVVSSSTNKDNGTSSDNNNSMTNNSNKAESSSYSVESTKPSASTSTNAPTQENLIYKVYVNDVENVEFNIDGNAILLPGQKAEYIVTIELKANDVLTIKDSNDNVINFQEGTELTATVAGNYTLHLKEWSDGTTLVLVDSPEGQDPTPTPDPITSDYVLYVNGVASVGMQENTSSVANVTAEYMVSVTLAKGDVITIKDSNGNSIEGLYWENIASTNDYVANVEGGYTLYLKFYQDGGKTVWVEAPVDPNATSSRIYYTNPNNWSTVYVYTWQGGNQYNGAWPGTKMNKDSVTGYYYTDNAIPGTNIIFNNGSGSQTGDLTIPTDGSNVYSDKWAVLTVA